MIKRSYFIKSFFIFLLFSFSIIFFGCSSKDNAVNDTEILNNNINQNNQFNNEDIAKEIDKEEVPDWLNLLSETHFSDIKKDGDNFSYIYQTQKTDNGEINRTLNYKKTDEGYTGNMKLIFSSKQDVYVENIPKTFAEHIDDLVFSIKPSKIINPDPIVEFKNIKGNLEIKSKKNISSDKIQEIIEKQLLDREFSRCEKLELREKISCALHLVSKYRGNKRMEKELLDANLDLSTVFGASVYAVEKQGFRKCKLVKTSEGQNLCYEYAYQVLVSECNSKTGLDYRTCVRDISIQLPNQEIRRLFCSYIDDKQMYNECKGTVSLDACDEISNKDQQLLCQLNIIKTKGDINLCEKIKNPDGKDICHVMLGMDQSNKDYCDLVEDKYYKGECLIKIATVNNDKEICNNITHKAEKDICLGYFLTKKDGISKELCEGFNDEFMKQTCNLLLVIQNNNINACDNIEDLYNKNLCYLTIAIKKKNKTFCNKLKSTKDKEICINSLKEKESSLPKIPDWMDCPIPKGAKIYKWNNKQQSGFKYVKPGNNNKVIGPSLKYWGANFAEPYIFECYNEKGEKNGPFKYYTQGGGILRKEGYYKNDKFDGIIKEYTKGILRSVWTFTEGIKNGKAIYYCINESCIIGSKLSEGILKNDRKEGFWTFYKKGEFDYKSEYINGSVTRDEHGMNIKYR